MREKKRPKANSAELKFTVGTISLKYISTEGKKIKDANKGPH